MENITNHINETSAFKKVLWFSRHNMTDAQLADLKRIYGNVEIVMCNKTVSSWREIVEAGKDCDILAVVLPPSILADLVNPINNKKPVIRAISKRKPDPIDGENVFVHLNWERVIKVEVVTKIL